LTFADKMLTRLLTLLLCFALIGCSQGNSSQEKSTQLMKKPIDFGKAVYQDIASKLDPQIDYGPEGESRDEPWTDNAKFRKWLEELNLGEKNAEALIEIVPPVSLAMNHGPLLGVECFIEENSEAGHKVREAGFLIFATGPNGDFVVVDMKDGNGQTGWLPMAMIWSMEAKEVREHFVPTDKTLGGFIRSSEEDWATVPKDWYDARDQAKKNSEPVGRDQ
jgi:hypothetical protein